MVNAVKVKNDCVQWIRDWFEINGNGCNAVIGVSGGKDSTVVAALCVEALGKNRVVGVMMPNGIQTDLDDAVAVCKQLEIKSVIINIEGSVTTILNNLTQCGHDICADGYRKVIPPLSEQTKTNLPARIRMATLYAVSQSLNGRVANTCNLSEDWIGYSTRWGDSVGDFSPLAGLTSDEVVAIGDACGLPYYLTHKTPADGLCGKSDEDNFGFTYDELNKYIRTGICKNALVKEKIDALHQKNLFKTQPIPCFHPEE